MRRGRERNELGVEEEETERRKEVGRRKRGKRRGGGGRGRREGEVPLEESGVGASGGKEAGRGVSESGNGRAVSKDGVVVVVGRKQMNAQVGVDGKRGVGRVGRDGSVVVDGVREMRVRGASGAQTCFGGAVEGAHLVGVGGDQETRAVVACGDGCGNFCGAQAGATEQTHSVGDTRLC